MKKVLVTGGSGFIGGALVNRLVRDGYSVRVLDNNSRGSARKIQKVLDQIEFITGDIRDAKTVSDACKGMDSVMHLAYINGTEFFYQKPEVILDVGVKGMINVIDACIEHGVRDLLTMSSSEVYQQPEIIPSPENVPLIVPDVNNPRYSYGAGKIISEMLTINYGRKNFDRVLIVRPHNVYGPDMGGEHVIPQFALRVAALAENKSAHEVIDFPMQGTGEETRAFCHINDFTDGMMHVIEKGEHMQVYHIGTQQEVEIREVAKLVGLSLGYDINLKEGPLTQGSCMRRCPDIGKIRGLGYNPKVSLEEGVSETAKWYRDNRNLFNS